MYNNNTVERSKQQHVPIVLVANFLPLCHSSSPSCARPSPPLTQFRRAPRTLLALLFLTHYAKRALLSPLRSPPRSKAHISVPLSGITFNLINGTLMGVYLASPVCAVFLLGRSWGSARFWMGIALWAAGLAGNVLHDEGLMDIRRDAQRKKNDAGKEGGEAKPHYGIPRRYFYRYVSYPNYLCEWAEWAGCTLAAAPLPSLSLSPLSKAAPAGLAGLLAGAAPPWLFFASEIFLMAPRAYRGHKWYRARFPDYATERCAVIPFVF
ncbi:hypothetical protein DFH11DRAFT_1688476 [Phellopilus nigrolimitatus]|nr:hypothetical protein DFH11DRAFT_1688476 [Phellopilus nigrolimitatus]